MRDYSVYGDEELIGLLRDGEAEIADYLIDKYKGLVLKNAGTMFILGADRDDLIQEGMIGLFKAIRDFDPGRDAKFSTFAALCVSRQMYTAVKLSNRKKHLPLNGYVSLNADNSEEGEAEGRGRSLMDILLADENSNPESRVIEQERLEDIQEIIIRDLSSLEQSVLELYMTGLSTAEAARILGRDVRSADNALQRVRMKLKKAI